MPNSPVAPSTLTDAPPAVRPVASHERIELLDILRGWAIFGILVNMRFYGSPAPGAWTTDVWGAAADPAASNLIRLLAVNKFWPLLSFLFGLGFGLHMTRAEARGSRVFPTYGRRLSVLLVFGLVHSLIFFGDYLHLYAALGFVLFLFRSRAPRTLAVIGFACVLLPWAYEAGAAGIREPRLQEQTTRAQEEARLDRRATLEQRVALFSHGTVRDIATANARRAFGGYTSLDKYLGLLGDPFPFFFLGLYAARRRLLENVQAHLPFIRRVMWWGLGLGWHTSRSIA